MDGRAFFSRRGLWALGFLGSIGFVGILFGVVKDESRGIPFVARETTWSIGVYEGASPFLLEDLPNLGNPVLENADVTDRDAQFIADPFVIEHDSSYFMFFEILDRKTQQGDIGLAMSGDGLVWAYDRVVLDEPFHLSYPYVFEWEGEFYLVPESEQAGSVRLYKAIRFPYEWEFVGTLLEGKRFVDASLFRSLERWWAFVSEVGNDILRLYYSEDLAGPWTEHPRSPLIGGNPGIARPGGRVFRFQNQLIRLAQNDFPTYGISVVPFLISELSILAYSEVLATDGPILEGSGAGWNKEGMHHLDPHLINGRWLGFVDGRTTKIVFGLDR